MDCAEACPLPDQEGCHPMKHCQPPWRRQSEPEISSEFRVQLRSEDPGRFSGAGSAAFSGWRLAMRKACCPQRAGKSGQTEAFMAEPMYVMEQLLHNRLLAVLFSVFTVLAALCVGSGVQAHSLTAVISRRLPVSVHWIGIAAALLAGSILIGGAKKTAKVCTCLVPVMSVLYLGSCLFLLVKNAAWIPAALQAIFVSAFSKKAVIGGIAGTAVKMAVRTGMAKGLFTNEAGMGSMPMTAAAAEGLSTRDQGLVSMTGVFWDTLVMCAVTALAILSDMVKNAAPYRAAAVDEYCFVAFSNLPVAGEDLLSLCLVLFAFATIIGWSFYGECAARYLWGERGVTVFQVIYMVFVYLGSVCSLELVWNLCGPMQCLHGGSKPLVSVEIERADCGKDPELIRGSGSFYGFWYW